MSEVVANSKEFCEIMGHRVGHTVFEIEEMRRNGQLEEVYGSEEALPCYDGVPSAKRYGNLPRT